MKRSFLFLQGVCSPFFGRLADRLSADGHRVFKVNFNAGDVAYWGLRPGASFRGRLPDLPEFLERIYVQHGITDQILFGDCRPVHRPAVECAKTSGIRTHVFEEGYFRPHWITLERGGVNSHSPLPRDPDWFRRVGRQLPDHSHGEGFSSPFWTRAAHDVAYHAAGFWNPLLFPHYRTHAPVTAAVEYPAYLCRLRQVSKREHADAALVRRLVDERTPFYLLPLQLGSDAQIRMHSRFRDMAEVIELVMTSFAAHAPTDSRLVIKNHPLDIGLVDYVGIIHGLSQRLNLSGRIDYLESGDLAALLRNARGCVTVNSTVGGHALGFGCPTLALSNPVYNIVGLTYQRPIGEFWAAPTPPDAELFDCFRNTVIHTAQINGGFYCKDGIAMTIRNCADTLVAERSPLEELL